MQKHLNNLICIRYNLQLRPKCIEEEANLKYTNPLHNDFIQDVDDPMIGWHKGQ